MIRSALFGISIKVAAPALLSLVGACSSAEARCLPASDRCPIPLKLRADGNSVTGQLGPQRTSYSYTFKARAGQILTWDFSGPQIHFTIRYPGGRTDGPFSPGDISLSKSGIYKITVSSNMMAENSFGAFRLFLKVH